MTGSDAARPCSRLSSEVGASAATSSFDVCVVGGSYKLGNVSDEPVLPRVASGDPTAVQECIDRYKSLVWWLARKQAGEDAEDAVQEIFIELWKSAPRFDASKASESTFVAMIARRRLIDRRRRRGRQPTMEAIEREDAFVEPASQVPELGAEVALASRAVAQLNERERSVLLLSVYQGMSHSEIAAHTGLPLGTVKTYIRRGLANVREMLAAGSQESGPP